MPLAVKLCLKVFYVSNTLFSAYPCVPWSQTDILSHSVKSYFELSQFCISCPCVKYWSEGMFVIEYLIPSYVSCFTTLRMFSMHNREPMFQVSSHFDMFWLGFNSLKVGHLLFCACVVVHNSGKPCLTSHIFDPVDPNEEITFASCSRGHTLHMFQFWDHDESICLVC